MSATVTVSRKAKTYVTEHFQSSNWAIHLQSRQAKAVKQHTVLRVNSKQAGLGQAELLRPMLQNPITNTTPQWLQKTCHYLTMCTVHKHTIRLPEGSKKCLLWLLTLKSTTKHTVQLDRCIFSSFDATVSIIHSVVWQCTLISHTNDNISQYTGSANTWFFTLHTQHKMIHRSNSFN